MSPIARRVGGAGVYSVVADVGDRRLRTRGSRRGLGRRRRAARSTGVGRGWDHSLVRVAFMVPRSTGSDVRSGTLRRGPTDLRSRPHVRLEGSVARPRVLLGSFAPGRGRAPPLPREWVSYPPRRGRRTSRLRSPRATPAGPSLRRPSPSLCPEAPGARVGLRPSTPVRLPSAPPPPRHLKDLPRREGAGRPRPRRGPRRVRRVVCPDPGRPRSEGRAFRS